MPAVLGRLEASVPVRLEADAWGRATACGRGGAVDTPARPWTHRRRRGHTRDDATIIGKLRLVNEPNGRQSGTHAYTHGMTSEHEDKLREHVHSDPEILGGTTVFVGTRVPAATFVEYLEAGDSIDDFLEDFPSVGRDRAVAALEVLRAVLERRAPAA